MGDDDETNVSLNVAFQTLDAEIDSLRVMRSRLGPSFSQAVSCILHTVGRVVVLGMGKSGIIGQKIAATLASTGTPSFFVHPADAFHGDLGMIHPNDIAVLISNSGETEEILRILPFLKHQRNIIIALVGVTNSTLTKHSNIVLDTGVERAVFVNNDVRFLHAA